MPKAILEFNLPDEQEEFKEAVNANRYFIALDEIREKLRGYLKYGHQFKTADEAIEKIQEEFFQILHDNEITLI